MTPYDLFANRLVFEGRFNRPINENLPFPSSLSSHPQLESLPKYMATKVLQPAAQTIILLQVYSIIVKKGSCFCR